MGGGDLCLPQTQNSWLTPAKWAAATKRDEGYTAADHRNPLARDARQRSMRVGVTFDPTKGYSRAEKPVKWTLRAVPKRPRVYRGTRSTAI